MLTSSARAADLTSIHERVSTRLRRYFSVRGQTGESEDLVQDTFVRLLQQGSGQSAIYTDAYIFTIAENLLRDRSRRSRVRNAVAAAPGQIGEVEMARVACDAPSPEQSALGKDELKRLLDAVGELKLKTRSIFLLSRVEQIPQREIASELGISVSAVEKHVAKAMAHIIARLER